MSAEATPVGVPQSFVVLARKEINQLSAGNFAGNLADALTAATARVQSDRHARYVVQIMCLVEVDPVPRVLVTPSPDPAAAPQSTREVANL